MKGLFLIRKRPIKEILGGMYEIPSSLWESSNLWESSKKFSNIELIRLGKNYKPIFLNKVIKHDFSHFTLFSKVIIIKKEKLIKNNIKGQWVNKSTIKRFPISNLTKKVIDYSLEEIFSLKKFL